MVVSCSGVKVLPLKALSSGARIVIGPFRASSSARTPVWLSASKKLSTPRKGSVLETVWGRVGSLFCLG